MLSAYFRKVGYEEDDGNIVKKYSYRKCLICLISVMIIMLIHWLMLTRIIELVRLGLSVAGRFLYNFFGLDELTGEEEFTGYVEIYLNFDEVLVILYEEEIDLNGEEGNGNDLEEDDEGDEDSDEEQNAADHNDLH